jgi:hypothetical protein
MPPNLKKHEKYTKKCEVKYIQPEFLIANSINNPKVCMGCTLAACTEVVHV